MKNTQTSEGEYVYNRLGIHILHGMELEICLKDRQQHKYKGTKEENTEIYR